MRTHRSAIAALALALTTPLRAWTFPIPGTDAAPARPAQVQPKDLPPAVRATVEAETKNAKLKGVSQEKENGKIVYELETMVGNRTRDLMIDSNGKVYIVEEEISPDAAPPAVKTALESRGRIVKLESVTENGQVRYEGHVRNKTGKTVAIELKADGSAYKK